MSAFMLSKNLLYLCCVLCLFIVTTRAQDNRNPDQILDKRCDNTDLIIAANSTYQSNLNFLLTTLSSNASRAANGFYNSTSGGVPQDISNTACGLFLCRGDVSSDVCQRCVSRACREALELCPDQKTAIFWYDKCLLRYSSESIFSRLDVSFGCECGDNSVCLLNVSDTDRFNQVLLSTMDEIARRASILDSGKYFAVQEAKFSVFRVYMHLDSARQIFPVQIAIQALEMLFLFCLVAASVAWELEFSCLAVILDLRTGAITISLPLHHQVRLCLLLPVLLQQAVKEKSGKSQLGS